METNKFVCAESLSGALQKGGSFHHRKKGKLTPSAEAREAGEGGWWWGSTIESLGKEKGERSRQDDRCHLVKKSHKVTEDSSPLDLGTCKYLCVLPPLNSKFLSSETHRLV